MIQDKEQQMDRWAEHYIKPYAIENVVIEDALDAIECVPELEELGREPTIDERSEAWTLLPVARHQEKTVFPLKY